LLICVTSISLVKPGSSYYGYLDDPSIRYFNSTPAGCALWGLKELSHARDFFNGEEPDIVVSGANNGPNLGTNAVSTSIAM
jgi:5'/3'-nucleotidase SurE